MRAVRLNSTMIEKVIYDPVGSTLAVAFRGGRTYLYHDVPQMIFEGLKRAESAGRYFNDVVKGRFRCEPQGRRFRPA